MTPEREMFDAIKAGDTARLREIVGARRNLVSAKDPSGLSPLMLACYAGLDDGVQALLAAGARLDVFEAAAVGDAARLAQQIDADPKLVHALSPDGFPPLNLAAYFGQAKTVDYLLEKGADPNAVSKNALRLRPIHGAAAHKNPQRSTLIAKKLLERGADVNVKQAGGWTPLHQAASSGNAELARALLSRGARSDVRSDDGRTPRDLAVEKGHALLAEEIGGEESGTGTGTKEGA
jgi:ankyrin repeat protein